GNLLFSEAIERYLQYKRGHGCPPDLDVYIQEILNQWYNYTNEDVVVASSWSKRSYLRQKLAFIIGFLNFDSNSLFHKLYRWKGDTFINIYFATRHTASLIQSGIGLYYAIKLINPTANFKKLRFSHHLTHITQALNCQDCDNAIGLVIDGQGDNENISIYSIHNGKITLKKKVKTYSLGDLYGIITYFSGYSTLKGEEWKVMGLSAYGKKDQLLYEVLKNAFFTKKGMNVEVFMKIQDITSKISKEDIAFTGQLIFEELFFHWVEVAKELVPNKENIIISGGSALNSLAIGKLHEKGTFKRVIVPNAPADDGNSLGAALLAYKENHPAFILTQKEGEIRSPYAGSEININELENYVAKSGLPFKKIENAPQYAAKLLHENKIIGWIQGRAEFGPRALGNRSILAHPGYKENKNRINKVVKFRESYRPFAPSILHEYGADYFEKYDFTPYMEKTLTFKDEVIDKVPVVVHADKTGRLQSVTEQINPLFHQLITSFYELTQIPIVVNTSYNVMGKPIAHDINDVMAVFFNSELDAVIIGNYVLERPLFQ
ncbi:MAG: carbamoyltransferase C-terminal domain-containing protein, partial [Crocinitomicaceae bacterium]